MSASRVTTLVVEDEVAVAGVHQGFLLAHGGFEVVGLAHTGEDAVREHERLRPELVLLDIHLPDMSGVEVLRRLRRLPGPPVDVIAVTAAQEAETVRAVMAGGVVSYLVKPFTMAVLHERLDHYLAHRAVVTGETHLDQRQIDRLLRAPEGRTPPPLPKGLSQESLDQVVTALHDVGDGSALEIGEAIGMSRVSVRRYLEHLVDSGRAVRRPRYGTAGRPEIGYRLQEARQR